MRRRPSYVPWYNAVPRREGSLPQLDAPAAKLLREVVGVAANQPSKQEETANQEKRNNDATEQYHVD